VVDANSSLLEDEGVRARVDHDWAGRTALWLVRVVPVAWLGVFFLAPLAITIVYSFANATYGGVSLGFTLSNFQQALSGLYLTIFLRTMEFAAIGTSACLLVGMPVAYYLARKVTRWRGLLLVLLLVPFWTSFLIRTLAWLTLLGADGPIRSALHSLGLISGYLNIVDTQKAVLIGIIYAYLPLMTLPLVVAFERVPTELTEAAKDLGAGRIRTFLSVTLPVAKPGVITAILLTAVPMTGEYVIPALLGGNKGVLLGGLIAGEYSVALNFALGSAMAVLILVVLGALVLVCTRSLRGFANAGAT
jgi:ABC-type spermidine/putrescine transport system permease subunit I